MIHWLAHMERRWRHVFASRNGHMVQLGVGN